MQSVQDVHDRIVSHYYKTDPQRLRKKGNVGNNTWAYPNAGEVSTVRYHSTEIVSAVCHDPTITPTLWLDHGGWRSVTTLQRLRWFLPAGVSIEQWMIRLARPIVDAYLPFDRPVGLWQRAGFWQAWGFEEPYQSRAELLRKQAITWARRYRPSLLENSSNVVHTWCATCTSAWPKYPSTKHFMEAHWQQNSRKVYNRRQVLAALRADGIQVANLDWVDPKIVRRALTRLVPDTNTLIAHLIVADEEFEAEHSNYN